MAQGKRRYTLVHECGGRMKRLAGGDYVCYKCGEHVYVGEHMKGAPVRGDARSVVHVGEKRGQG